MSVAMLFRKLFILFVSMAVGAMEPAAAKESPAANMGPDGMVKDLLAQHVGGAVCFTGSFAGRAVNVWDYSKAKQVPVPGLFQFGKQVTRPEPAVSVNQEVMSLTLLLSRDGRKHESWDEMHDFRLKITLKDWGGALYSAGECPWSAADKPAEGTKANTSTLYCGVDCDGGGMEVERVAGTGEVVFRFHASSGGLRMSAGGCGYGQLHLGGEAKPFDAEDRRAEQHPVAFRLTAMPKKACRAFRKATDKQ
jgi:hypothetical protein